MEQVEFQAIKKRFSEADTEEKINIYISAENLNQEQYKDLLRLFPLNELYRLEAALL